MGSGGHGFEVAYSISGSGSSNSGSERVLSPSTEEVLDSVRRKVDKQYPSLTPTLYPIHLMADKVPFGATYVCDVIDVWGFGFNKNSRLQRRIFSVTVFLGSASARPLRSYCDVVRPCGVRSFPCLI